MEIKIINKIDFKRLDEFLTSDEGKKVILKIIERLQPNDILF